MESFVKLSDTDKAAAQSALQQVLSRQDTVTMIILGSGHEGIANTAKEIAKNRVVWCAVWVPNPALLSAEQLATYQGGDPDVIVCVLSKSNQPKDRIKGKLAESKSRLEKAFLDAGQA